MINPADLDIDMIDIKSMNEIPGSAVGATFFLIKQ